MTTRKYDFPEEVKNRALLWCARHCCLCGKFCGVGIEVAHIDPKSAEQSNAIPLCFDCHATIGHYNKSHPRGRKYNSEELKIRREQVYETHTRPLVSPVKYVMSRTGKGLPNTGFSIVNLGQTHPLKARVRITISQGTQRLGHPETLGHYDGRFQWNLNPQFGVNGHFDLPTDRLAEGDPLIRALVEITLIDIYDRPHDMLPGGYILSLAPNQDWYYEPCVELLGPQPE